MITSESIYNIKDKKKVMRTIHIVKIEGVSKALMNNSKEFTIHIPSEYDYRFISDRRDEIIEILKQRFIEKMSLNLPIFGIPSPDLRDYTTTEKDAIKFLSRFPPLIVFFNLLYIYSIDYVKKMYYDKKTQNLKKPK